MSQKTITYVKTYQTNQFHFDKLGLEETFPTDKPDKDCILELSERIDAMAKELYPWVFANGSATRISVPYGMAENTIEIPVIQKQKANGDEKPLSTKDQLLLDISTCKDKKVLQTYDFIIKNTKSEKDKIELRTAYDKRMASLQTD